MSREHTFGTREWAERRHILARLVRIKPALKVLDDMIGLKTIKQSLLDMVLCCLQGLQRNQLYNCCITGAPGHGKTELARNIARLYAALGIVNNPNLIECRRDTLLGQYLGQTAPKVRKLLEDACASGRPIFLDEVTSMACPGKGSQDSYAKAALDCINHYLYNNKDCCMIVAGYGRDAPQNVYNCFFDLNPGLVRRFPFIYHIPAYTAKETNRIFHQQIRNAGWTTADDTVGDTRWFECRLDEFPNGGGDTEILMDRCIMMHARRVFGMTKKLRKRLTSSDLEQGFRRYQEYRKQHDQTCKTKEAPVGMYC